MELAIELTDMYIHIYAFHVIFYVSHEIFPLSDLSTKIFSNIYISFLLALALYCNPTLESNKLTHAVFIIQRE